MKQTQEVTIYTTPMCPYCKMAKEFFKKHNIKYKETDVAADPKKAEEMIKKSGSMSVPVIIIKNGSKENIAIGFKKEKIIKLLKLN